MRLKKLGAVLKNNAPQWLRSNKLAVALYDRIFENNNSRIIQRAGYLSLVGEEVYSRLFSEERLGLDQLFEQPLKQSAVRLSPIYLKFSLFQLELEATTRGRNLTLMLGKSDPLADLLSSVAFSLGLERYSSDGCTVVTTRSAKLQNSPYHAVVRDDGLLRSLQFVAGLRIRRSVLIVVGNQQEKADTDIWNANLRRLLKISDGFHGNILIFENSASNNLASDVYTEIMGRINVALLPGKITSPELCRRLQLLGPVIRHDSPTWDSIGSTPVPNILRKLNRERSIVSQSDRGYDPDLSGEYSQDLVKGSLPGAIALAQSDNSTEVINGVQRYIVNAFEAKGRKDGASGLETLPAISSANAFLQWGASESKRRRRLRRNAKNSAAPLLFIEDGFIRSVEIGLTGSPGLSFLIDDLAPYYEAREWSRIELMLASDWKIRPEQRDQASASIEAIRKRRISKYNHAPDYTPSWQVDRRRKILLVDQRNGDQSVASGLASAMTFRHMVRDATEMKDALVILKRHPDATIGSMGSYFSESNLGPLLSHSSVIFQDAEINPYALFDAVDEVWCVTSGMGFEALIAGKKVKVYGAPFYAGWGLTEDRLKLDWRRRMNRSLAEIFYCAYLARTVYFDEKNMRKCGLDELVAQVFDDRERYLLKAMK